MFHKIVSHNNLQMVDPAPDPRRDVSAAEVLLQARRADCTHPADFELVPDCNLGGHNV